MVKKYIPTRQEVKLHEAAMSCGVTEHSRTDRESAAHAGLGVDADGPAPGLSGQTHT